MSKSVNSFDLEEGSLLNQPLSISDLITNGSVFEIENESGFESTTNFDDFGAGSDDDDDEKVGVDFKNFLSPWEHKYDELRASMTKFSDGIYKKIIKAGDARFGLPKINYRVVIDYSSFKELDVKPVDSTFLRGKKQILNTGANEIVPGLEIAICSMLKGETAHFLISHEHLYGELGCPPRIPPKCELLFVVQLLDFSEIGDLNAIDDINEEDRNCFSIIFPRVEEVHKKGKDFFALKNYEYAARAFLKAVQALEHCRVADEGEQEKQTNFLKVLYLNLVIVYYKKDLPKKVCMMLNTLRRVDEKAYYRNVKALYFEGQALFKLTEYDRAKVCLRKAQRLEPQNTEINKALRSLAEAEAKHKAFERELCERTFGIINATKKNDIKKKEDAIAEGMKKSLEEFKNDANCTEMNFPSGLTNAECSAVEEIIRDLDLKLIITSFGNKTIYKN